MPEVDEDQKARERADLKERIDKERARVGEGGYSAELARMTDEYMGIKGPDDDYKSASGMLDAAIASKTGNNDLKFDKGPEQEPVALLRTVPGGPVKSIHDAFADVVVGQFLADERAAEALCAAFARANITLTRPTLHAAPPPPEAAPKLWADRPRGRDTNPAAFIREVYAEWLPNSLARQDLKQLDPKLYTAYAQWTRPGRHPDDTVTFASKRPPPNKLDDAEFASRQRAARAAWITQQRAAQKRKGPGET